MRVVPVRRSVCRAAGCIHTGADVQPDSPCAATLEAAGTPWRAPPLCRTTASPRRPPGTGRADQSNTSARVHSGVWNPPRRVPAPYPLGRKEGAAGACRARREKRYEHTGRCMVRGASSRMWRAAAACQGWPNCSARHEILHSHRRLLELLGALLISATRGR